MVRREGSPNIKNSKKVQAVNTFRRGNISKKEVARRFAIQPSQLRLWLRKENEIKMKVKVNVHSMSLHRGPKPAGCWFEEDLKAWVDNLRSKDLAVSSKLIVTKIVSIDPTFQSSPKENRLQYVYRFLRRQYYTFRRTTHRGQKLISAMDGIQVAFVDELKSKLSNVGILRDVKPIRFVNMDQTAVYFEPQVSKTINKRGLRTVAVRSCGSNSHRLSAFLAVSSDGTKLPPFIVFKAKPNGRIEKNMRQILPDDMFGCVQTKGWADDRGMGEWFHQVWKPFIARTMDDDEPIMSNMNSSLLLIDDFKCHRQPSFNNLMSSLGTYVQIIPGGYTCRLQPCDVGLNRPLKVYIEEKYLEWAAQRFLDLGNDESLPVPNRQQIAAWLLEAWENAITPVMITNTFKKIGYI